LCDLNSDRMWCGTCVLRQFMLLLSLAHTSSRPGLLPSEWCSSPFSLYSQPSALSPLLLASHVSAGQCHDCAHHQPAPVQHPCGHRDCSRVPWRGPEGVCGYACARVNVCVCVACVDMLLAQCKHQALSLLLRTLTKRGLKCVHSSEQLLWALTGVA